MPGFKTPELKIPLLEHHFAGEGLQFLAGICIIRMYSEGGFPLIRMPSATLGVSQSVAAITKMACRLIYLSVFCPSVRSLRELLA